MRQHASTHDDLAYPHTQTATDAAASILDLLAAAAEGDLAAAQDAHRRYRALYDYLAQGGNPLPGPWSHSNAWQDPDHDPGIAADLTAALADTFPPQDDSTDVDMSDDASPWVLDFNDDPHPEEATATPFFIVAPVTPTVRPTPSVVPPAHLPSTADDQTTRRIRPARLYTHLSYGPDSPLSYLKTYVEERVDDGLNCPVCETTLKVRPRTIRAELAFALIRMWHAGNTSSRDWFYLPEIRDWKSRDEALLASFGLIEMQTRVDPTNGKRGWWRLTFLGEQFVTKQVTIPTYADVFQGKTRRVHGAPVTIEDCLATEWDYALLMANPHHLP